MSVPPPPPAPSEPAPPPAPMQGVLPPTVPVPPFPTQGVPPFQGLPVPPPVWRCRFCGAVPAENTTVYGHRGIVLWMQFRELAGPFCRTCGTAAVRDMSAQTMAGGWWGPISFPLSALMLVRNLFVHRKIKRLPEPVPGWPGRQMDPRRPLWQRWQVAVLLIPLTFVGLVGYGIATDSGSSGGSADTGGYAVGDCVINNGTDSDPYLTEDYSCGPGSHQVLAVLPNATSVRDCPAGTTLYYVETHDYDHFVLCLG